MCLSGENNDVVIYFSTTLKLKNISYIQSGVVYVAHEALVFVSFHFLHDGLYLFISPNRVKSANTNCGETKVILRANGSRVGVEWAVVGLG